MSKIKIDERFNAIVDAVCYWLGYQLKIGRDRLIHEATLRYPIADTITAKGIKINRVVLEKLHPLFKSKKIDLVVFDEDVEEPEAEKDDNKLIEAFEFKLVKSKTGEYHSDEHQRVFDDVVRLAYYHMWGGKDCYFLMCGKYEEFKAYFIGQKKTIKVEDNRNIVTQHQLKPKDIPNQFDNEVWDANGLYKDWFDFGFGKERIVQFRKDDSTDWGLESFQNNYELRDKDSYMFSDSIVIKTTCMAITPAGERNRTHAAGIWKIESVSSTNL